jgi:hypothetical protein
LAGFADFPADGAILAAHEAMKVAAPTSPNANNATPIHRFNMICSFLLSCIAIQVRSLDSPLSSIIQTSFRVSQFYSGHPCHQLSHGMERRMRQ